MSLRCDTLVFFALGRERKPFQRLEPQFPHLQVRVCGMGPLNARAATEAALSELKPRRVLTCGLCGGLNPSLLAGAIFFETASAELATVLSTVGASRARFTCTDRIAITREEKERLWKTSRADLVEMESGAIHAVCADRGIECATLRAISDTANDNLPLDFNQLARPDQTLDPFKLAWAIARKPHRIPALMRLGSTTSRVAALLADTVARVATELQTRDGMKA